MEFITTREDLRQHYGDMHDIAAKKTLSFLDGHSKSFIARSPFVLIGSSDNEGNGDVTPKGDLPGFVAVLDDHTLAIPDRPGNNRLDTFENLIVNPAVGLLFLIPGMNETLRINGVGRLTRDDGLRERLSVNGKPPITVLVVTVKTCYMHCAKAFIRSSLWKPATWPERASMPTLGTILCDQIKLAESATMLDRALDEAYSQTLW